MNLNTQRWFVLLLTICLVGIGCVNAPTEPVQDTKAPSVPTNVLKRLDLSNQGLTQVSQDVFKKTYLTELDLSNNKLTGALPGEIRQLSNLIKLDVSDNQMTGVPAEVGQLQNLRELDLSNNQFTGLPLELGNLSSLELLDLRGNVYSTQDLEKIKASLANTEILTD